MPPNSDLAALQVQWEASWQPALALWSKFTRLRDPRWCLSLEEAKSEGLTESFAMIRLLDQTVVIDLDQIQRRQLQAYPLEILGHEIGHHVFCPADLTDNARVLSRMRWALPGKEHLAPLIANLYADLLVNDRLERSAGVRIADVYRIIGGGAGDPLWTLYMRIYEILWALPKGTLARGPIGDRLEGDAQLGARLVRSYARDWLDGAGRFAALCLPYVLGEPGEGLRGILGALRDMAQAGKGAVPPGLSEIQDGEREGAIHPALDPVLSGIEPGNAKQADATLPPVEAQRPTAGQYREPFEYGQILRALGLDLSDHEVAVRFYRELAGPHLVRFPTRPVPKAGELLPEGLEPWPLGAPLEDADWRESVLISPHVVPGMTTMQRVWGREEDAVPVHEPLDLDLYVDSSGSMPDPQIHLSYAALAGVIVALSALRAGSRVQVTLWSGARQFQSTPGFVDDQYQVMQILTGYIGGGTAFPIHRLRETYATRSPGERSVHILIVSDSGVTTIFEKDEHHESGLVVAQAALEKAGGGGTMVLNISPAYKDRDLDLAIASGWTIDRVSTSKELVDFARSFSSRLFGGPARSAG